MRKRRGQAPARGEAADAMVDALAKKIALRLKHSRAGEPKPDGSRDSERKAVDHILEKRRALAAPLTPKRKPGAL